MNPYLPPMSPYPGFEPFVSRVKLPECGVELFLYDTGSPDAEPYLLVHGLGDESDTWRGVLPGLAERYRVLALDLPGFGRSSKPRRAYTVTFYQQVLLELLGQLNLGQVRLAGHSLGALLAHSFTLEHPTKVTHLVLLGGSLLMQSQGLSLSLLLSLIPGVGEWSYTRLRRAPQKAYQTLAPYYADLAGLPAAERSFLFTRVNQRVWDDAQRYAYFSIFRNLAGWVSRQQRGLVERLADWQIPTRLVWGELDHLNSPENGRQLARLQPNTTLHLIAGAGHNVQQEAPARTLAVLAA